MSENNQNNRNFTSVIKNKRAFFSGLDWKTLPSEEKNARTFARKNDAEYFLSCQYQDSENETKTMVAFIRKEDLPTGASSFWSLALMIKPSSNLTDTLSANSVIFMALFPASITFSSTML